MRRLLSFTCLTPIALVSITPAFAETVIKDARTAPVRTATANAGAADSVTIDTTGSIKLTSGTAVTMDSDHQVNNKGTITITDSNGATGILALPNRTGAISNSGTITIDETYAPTDADKDGDIDGPFAQGSGRYGIRVGTGHTGNIVNSGTIAVEGNGSFGLALDGPVTGSLTNSGKIDIVGDNSFGVRAGNVSGNVVLEGTIAARGANSVGAALTGDIGGALRVQGSIIASGYRSITPPGDVSKLDADDLLQGGNALRVSGNIAGGIILDAPPRDSDPKDDDEDKDGVKDASEGTASVTSYGSAAAFQIGASDRAVTIGAVSGNAQGHGLVINGNVSGQGVYKAVDGNGLVIGGLGQAVTIAGGMTVNGRVEASSLDQNATALRIGNLARVNEIMVNGGIGATGGGAVGTRVAAIQIDAGATTGSLSNKGAILVKVNGDKAIGTAVLDRSGTLSSIVNQGRIAIEGAAGTDRAIALDLGANTTGVTITQSRLSATATVPEITGNILLGSGNDVIDSSAGKIVGKILFGAGNDRLKLSSEASYSGAVSFGSGTAELSLADKASFMGSADFGDGAATLTLGGTSRFSGLVTGSTNTAVSVNGGSLALLNTGAVKLASLSVGAQGTIGVFIDGVAKTNTLIDVAGAAQFAAGSKVLVNLSSVGQSAGTYTFLKAGALLGAPALLTDNVSLPFLFKGNVQTNAAANTASVVIARKAVSELGLNSSEASAFDAIAIA
ncbi:MAG: autotransporter domain-containing protein, partial [Sphingomonadaceae bacterium]|nr:autotransporter domain-containing protein [Sphingomonadaceae bacterium]